MTPEALAALHARCFETSPRPWSAVEFTDILAISGVHLLTVEGGFAVFRIAGPEAELMTIAVDPAERRKGRGKALMAKLLDAAGQAGTETVFLEVAETNQAAIKLYENQGFEPVGHRKDYYQSPKGPKITAIVMQKAVDPRS